MNTLKPCPFCGGTKICTEKGINLNYCDNCSAESNVEHWNTRPIEDALNARIAELSQAVGLITTLKPTMVMDTNHPIVLELKGAWLEQTDNEGGYAVLDDFYNRIAELEEKQRWIPVSERLPDNWESVLTFDISKSTRGPVAAFYNPETSLWSTHFSCDLWVTHWMPLPEPPIVYGKVCE